MPLARKNYLELRKQITSLESRWDLADSNGQPTHQLEHELAQAEMEMYLLPATSRLMDVLTYANDDRFKDFRITFLKKSCLAPMSFTEEERKLLQDALAKMACVDDPVIQKYLTGEDEV